MFRFSSSCPSDKCHASSPMSKILAINVTRQGLRIPEACSSATPPAPLTVSRRQGTRKRPKPRIHILRPLRLLPRPKRSTVGTTKPLPRPTEKVYLLSSAKEHSTTRGRLVPSTPSLCFIFFTTLHLSPPWSSPFSLLHDQPWYRQFFTEGRKKDYAVMPFSVLTVFKFNVRGVKRARDFLGARSTLQHAILARWYKITVSIFINTHNKTKARLFMAAQTQPDSAGAKSSDLKKK